MKYELINNLLSEHLQPIERVLVNRGIKDVEAYLNKQDKDINQPIMFPEDKLKDAATALIKTINANKNCIIVIDCDADGMTSSAILVNYLYKLFPSWVENNLKWIMHEGKQHGLEDVIDLVKNSDLIFCPDSQSNDYEQHKILYDMNKTVIILDHHEAEKISDYAITINNQLCDYPNKSLSGAGVTWQFCRYIDSLLNTQYAEQFIDLVALGLVSDMVDIREIETSYIISKGFREENIRNPYIVGMFEKNSFSLKGKITPIGCAFYITPFINAVMRSGTMKEKELLFNSMLEHKADTKILSNKRGHKEGEMETILAQTLRMCTNVKNRQKNTEEEGIKFLEEQLKDNNLLQHKSLVFLIKNNEIEPEIRGLCANKFANLYQKPTFVLTETIQYNDIDDSIPPWEDQPENENSQTIIYQGQVRGYTKSGLYNFKDLCQASELTEYCTGHQNAFGIGIKKENLNDFISFLDEALLDLPNEPIYRVDFLFNRTEINPNDILEIGRYEDIWGQELDEPLIGIINLNIDKSMVSLLSKDKNPTLKITLKNGITIMKFKQSEEEYKKFTEEGYKTINIVGTAQVNVWRDQVTPQILLKDYEIIGSCNYDF